MAQCIFMAAGEASRWNNHLGVRKHFLIVDGEPILHRAVRLVRELTGAQPFVVGPDLPEYRTIPHGLYAAPHLNRSNGDADKILSSKALWPANERTLVFWGDCWFSSDAMRTILAPAPDGITFYGRANASRFTGKSWGELFALSFESAHQAELLQSLYAIVQARKDGVIARNGGWELYRRINNYPLHKHHVADRFVEIDDFTDDFDYPDDFNQWIERFELRSQ